MFYFIPYKKNVQLLTTLFSVYSQSFLKDVLSESSSFKIRSKKSSQASVALLEGSWRSDHAFLCLQKLEPDFICQESKNANCEKMACRQTDKFKSGVSYQGVIGPSMYCQKNALNC